LPGEFGEALLRGHPVGDRLLGVFVLQFVEAETAAFDDFQAAGQRVLVAAEQPGHFRGRLQMALGMGGETKPGFADRAMLADAGHHILQRPPLGHVVVHIVGREERQPGFLGDRGEPGEVARIVAAIEVMRREIGASAEIRRHARGEFRDIALVRRQHDEDLPLAMRRDIGVVEMAFAFRGAPLAEGQQTGQPAIGGAVFGKGEEAGAVGEVEPHADHQADADCLRRVMGAHDAGDAVAVGDRDRLVAERRRGHHQLVRMRCAAQKREIGGDLQLRVARPPLRQNLFRKRRHGQTSAACGRRR